MNERSIIHINQYYDKFKVTHGGASKKSAKTLEFDRVFGMYSQQTEVYDSMVKPIVEEAVRGYNCTVFAYGQTGTGKTHTMEGSLTDNEAWGMIPRATQTIFDMLSSISSDFTVKISYLEICKYTSARLL
jgi:kinesin family protein 11